MVLKDTAPNEEVRAGLLKWTGMLILLGRQTRLPFDVQFSLMAQMANRIKEDSLGVKRNAELWEIKQEWGAFCQEIIENYLQYLPREIMDSEGDLQKIVMGCTKKETKILLEEYYFQQTGDRIGKDDEVSKRIIREGV